MTISNQHLELFQFLFKGREDIYARWWEDEDGDGYMPANNVDWDRYEKLFKKRNRFYDEIRKANQMTMDL